MTKKYFLILIAVFLLSVNVYALGISPSKIELDFQPNLKQEFEFLALNSLNVSFPVEVFISGELEQYTNFEKQNVVLEPYENRAFKFTLELPDEFDEPGNHTADLVVLQKELIQTEGGDYTIGAVVSVRSPMIVFVPFDGPFVDVIFESRNVEIGKEVPFLITFNNLGTEPIDQINGEVIIFDSKEESVGSLTLKESLNLNEEKQITLLWDSGDNTAGIYSAILKIDYSGGSSEEKAEFKLGSYFVDILEYQKEIEKGKINKYESIILSTWNDPLQSVYAQLDINYLDELQVFKSESFALEGWENKTVTMFVDGTSMEKGTYPAKLSVFYGNTSTSINFDIEVITNRVIIYTVAGIIVFVAVLLFILLRKKLFKRNKK